MKPAVFSILLAPGCQFAAAAPQFVPVRMVWVAPRYEAYAQVGPIALLPVRSALAGMVTGRGVLPGGSVQAGEPLASLSGPEVEALRAQDDAAVRGAREAAAAADRALQIARRQQPSHLTTEQAVLQAEADAVSAHGRLASAEAQRQALGAALTLKAPAAGIVVQVNAADGERVAAGDPVFTLQPAAGLWLHASYYGADAAEVRVGMGGEFTPENGSASGTVKVATVSPALAGDGSETVGLVATGGSVRWPSGTYGTVVLRGPACDMPVVPTQALILDQAHWWVLVRAAQGFRQQEVEPGPAEGWDTVVERGLRAGQQVLATNAYLEFHAGIAYRYQPPD